jgi:tRNA (guanine-N7-)-methyltransferase
MLVTIPRFLLYRTSRNLFFSKIYTLKSSILEYSEININKTKSRIKVRQHVNPLASKYQIPLNLSKDWLSKSTGIFDDSNRPLYIDIGCAKGTWAINMAINNPNCNFLGIEIRRPMVDLAMKRKKSMELRNVHFLASNVNVDLKRILNDIKLENITIAQISIQFPDPNFKKKHQKRKAVNEELVQIIHEYTTKNTPIFLQSDILNVTIDMITCFLQCKEFTPAPGYKYDSSLDLVQNPSTVNAKTEREIATEVIMSSLL